MLQALGSNTKTKIAYAMFGGCCFLIAGAIFVARMERIEYDDTYAYCATVYYSPKTGYRIEYWGQRNDFEKISTGCARACYKDQKATNGLSLLEVETLSGYSDQHQAFAAGMLEGSLTWNSIYAQWKNTIQSFCERDGENEQFCDWLRDIVKTNYQNVLTLAKNQRHSDNYQYQVFLYYQQLMGIETGFKTGVKRARRDYEIPFVDFLLLNARVDIEDLKLYYNEFVVDDEDDLVDINPRVGKMMLKILMEQNTQPPKILVGQSSDGEYAAMLKMVKTYRFNYHQGPDSASRLVTNTDITFTSYPGAISSSDDFYVAMGKHTRIVVAGVPLKHFKSAQNLRGIDLEGTVFSSARVMAANRLAHNGKFWSRIMSRDPDLGAKQWLVVDEKKIKYLSIDPPTIEVQQVVIETVTSSTTTDEGLDKANDIPTDIVTEPPLDISLTSVDLIRSPSNRNLVWLIDQTYRRLHAEDVTDTFRKDGTGWVFDGVPYFEVIQKLNGLLPKDIKINTKNFIENVGDVLQFLKKNTYRGDLLDNPVLFGNTDLKVYSSDNHLLTVQSGPIVTNTSHAFDWGREEFSDIRHTEQPKLWNFSPIQVQFFWNWNN